MADSGVPQARILEGLLGKWYVQRGVFCYAWVAYDAYPFGSNLDRPFVVTTDGRYIEVRERMIYWGWLASSTSSDRHLEAQSDSAGRALAARVVCR